MMNHGVVMLLSCCKRVLKVPNNVKSHVNGSKLAKMA